MVIGTAAARKGNVGLQKPRASPSQMLIKPPGFMVEREATLGMGRVTTSAWFKMKHCWQAYKHVKNTVMEEKHRQENDLRVDTLLIQ